MSIFDVSLETGNQFYAWGWKASIFGAFVTLVGVTFLMWGTRVRDRDFESNIANLNISAATANAEAAKANENAAALSVRAATLENDAAAARLEQEQLKKRLAWREVSLEQKAALVLALKGQSFEISISYTSSDPEAQEYARQIRRILIEAGLKIPRLDAVLSAQIQSGISINGADGPDYQTLGIAFNRAGIPLFRGGDTMALGLTVGPKPREQ